MAREIHERGFARVAGLMTDAAGDLTAFDRLRELRKEVAEGLAVPEEALGLTMGTSKDYEEAGEMSGEDGSQRRAFKRGIRYH